jgi:hypothetical protein
MESPEMDADWTQVVLPRLLEIYELQSLPPGLPEKRQKANWQPENTIGFFKGIFVNALQEDKHQIMDLLGSPDFLALDRPGQKAEVQLLQNRLFNLYIYTFHQQQNFAFEDPPGTPNSTRSAFNSMDSTAQTKLKEALTLRDGCCLFCWDNDSPEAAHIFSRKTARMPNIDELLQRAGVPGLYHVQNGLFLCGKCHGKFDTLKMFVDVQEDKMLVKLVNPTDDENNDDWRRETDILRDIRKVYTFRRQMSDRIPPGEGDDIQLQFLNPTPDNLPSKEALNWHKAACHIWRMAGGAEPKDIYYDDEDDFVPPVSAKESMDRVRAWNSSVLTLTEEIKP